MAIKYESCELLEGENYLEFVKNKYGDDANILRVEQVRNDDFTSVNKVRIYVGFNDKKTQNLDSEILQKLSDKIEHLISTQGEVFQTKNNLEIPPEFIPIYKKIVKSGMQQNHLDEIMLTSIKNMPKSLYSNKDAIKKYFETLFKTMIPCNANYEINKQKIMMLVGPTGVGKTTTLAKLAHFYAYGKNRYKTALISLDDFRLGARSQLEEYAAIMNLVIRNANTADELQKSIELLNSYDIILIDSTGNSQYDKKKLEKLEKYLLSSSFEIEVSLVLSAGMKYDDLYEIYNAFDILKVKNFIFTKFDETKSFGDIFSLIFNAKKEVLFFSIGQNVPNDIKIASSEYLVNCILNGFEG